MFGDPGGARISCGALTGAEECLGPARARGLDRTVFWLGNSQLYSIRQFAEGERTAPLILARRLRARGIETLTFAIPNATLVEEFLIFRWLVARRAADVLILPVEFNTTRELSIRTEVALALDDPRVAGRRRAKRDWR